MAPKDPQACPRGEGSNAPPPRNYIEYYQRGPHIPYLRSFRSAGSDPIAIFELGQPAGAFPDPPMDDFALQLITAGRIEADISFGGHRIGETVRPGMMYLCPSQTEASYEVSAAHALLVLGFPADAARRLCAQEDLPELTDFGRLHERGFADPLVAKLMRRMHAEAADGSKLGHLFADAALAALIVALLRQDGRTEADRFKTRGMDQTALARVTALIEERLDDNLTVDDLAQAARLPPFQFARAFKHATGVSPHQFVLARRVERAQALLAEGSAPLAEIALDCGFASQSHMTDVFRARLGVTPGRYRKDRRL